MNKRAQSIVEYVLITTLIILGIVFMGPYVLRSVGAHFKLWDYSVQDSFDENLSQAPVNDVSNVSLNCTCHYVKGSCGGTVTDGEGSCGANQREYDLDCGTSPQGCSSQPASICENDPTCCSAWVNVACGTFPCPAGGCPTTSTSPPQGVNLTNCYYGYEIQAHECGSDTTVQCVAVPYPQCSPQCLGVVNAGATACPDEPPANGTPLLQSYAITYVNEDLAEDCSTPGCTYCDPTQNCQYYMSNPAIKCVYDGAPFSGSYEGDFEGPCAFFTNNKGGDCGRGGGSAGTKYLSFLCTDDYLTGWCDYDTPHYEEGQTWRGINKGLTPGCSNGSSSSDIICNGITGSQTYYWENCNGESSCYDGIACGSLSYQVIDACKPWSGGSCEAPACSNDSFTISCDGSGHLKGITLNNASPAYTPVPMHGCNWSGAQTFNDFGGGGDMTWTCDVSSGNGVLTQVEFIPTNGTCDTPLGAC